MQPIQRDYFDHAAATPIAPEVLEGMMPFFDASYSNPSSLHTSGRKANEVLSSALHRVASLLHAEDEEIIFTGSGTESDVLAIIGTARAHKQYGNHILVSFIEHKAVLEAVEYLKKEGFIVEYIPVSPQGLISVEDCLSRITDQTILVSVMYANNEIGTIQPIKELARAIQQLKEKRKTDPAISTRHSLHATHLPLIHTDACQAAGYLSLDITELGVDLMSLNGSKIYGPKGVGVLFKRKGIMLEPVICGGGQEHGFRSGTENLPAIVGMSLALDRVEKKKEEEGKRLCVLRDRCIANLFDVIPGIVLNGHAKERLPNTIHISIPYVEGESVVLMLDHEGIEVATGSACSSHSLSPSHVLLAIGQDPTLLHGSIRITLGESTTEEACKRLVRTLTSVVERLRSLSPLTITL
jgi:cysteine desulfurase